MIRRKSFILIPLLTMLMIFGSSCSEDENNALEEDQQSESASTNFIANAILQGGRQSDLTIDTFLMNIDEIELEYDEEGDWEGDDDYYDDLELEGPFELVFTPNGTIVPITNVDIPEGRYEEIEFDIERSTNSDSELFGKSVMITGTLNGLPFIFWHDFEDELEVDFEDSEQDIIILGDGQQITISIDLSVLFNEDLLDLSQAQDGNGDKLIEISPQDPDGNQELADEIKELITEGIDLDD